MKKKITKIKSVTISYDYILKFYCLNFGINNNRKNYEAVTGRVLNNGQKEI